MCGGFTVVKLFFCWADIWYYMYKVVVGLKSTYPALVLE